MRAEELMIGDWVLVKELDHNNKSKVISEYQHQIILKDFSEMYNASGHKQYDPILLNNEIFEKNGFMKTESGGYWILGKNEYANDLLIEKVNYGYIVVTPSLEDKADHIYHLYLCDLHYVTDLQHCLKNFKINKNIVIQ